MANPRETRALPAEPSRRDPSTATKVAVRFAKAAGVIASVAATAASALQGFTPQSLLLAGGTIIGAIVLMVLIAIFSRVPDDEPGLKLPARILIWTAVATAVVVTVMIVTYAGALMKQSLATTDAGVAPPAQEIRDPTTGDIPDRNRTPLPNSPSPSSRRAEPDLRKLFAVSTTVHAEAADDAIRRELRNRGSLGFRGKPLVLEGGRPEVYHLVADVLTLSKGSGIVTNGRRVEIRVNKLVAQEGSILSFAGSQPSVPTTPGSAGTSGRPGGYVVLASLDGVEGSLVVNLSGEPGGDGAAGAQGAQGTPGSRGANAVDGFGSCRSGGQDGGGGGRGERGLPGGDGGNGGAGGTLELGWSLSPQTPRVLFDSFGGLGGKGGAGGPGGPGGYGGQGGSGSTFCGGGHGGPMGPGGDTGPNGKDGSRGADGRKIPMQSK